MCLPNKKCTWVTKKQKHTGASDWQILGHLSLSWLQERLGKFLEFTWFMAHCKMDAGCSKSLDWLLLWTFCSCSMKRQGVFLLECKCLGTLFSSTDIFCSIFATWRKPNIESEFWPSSLSHGWWVFWVLLFRGTYLLRGILQQVTLLNP